MLEAQDILFIVLAFCALWVTVFICWFIYQVAKAMKVLNDLVSDVRHQIERVELALHGIRGKFDSGSERMSSIADQVKKAVSDFRSK